MPLEDSSRSNLCDKWMDWMEACVFQGQVLDPVNGSPTKEFRLQKGLRQGDPLAPFLFLIVAEGLGGLTRRVVELGKFTRYSFHQSSSISHLQYVVDTLLVGKTSYDNLWTLKIVLRSFKMVSGLKINFLKCSLFGINVGADFLSAGYTFLSCISR